MFETQSFDHGVTRLLETDISADWRCNIWHVRGRDRDLSSIFLPSCTTSTATTTTPVGCASSTSGWAMVWRPISSPIRPGRTPSATCWT